jgi:deoxyribodipyrimidine photolyase
MVDPHGFYVKKYIPELEKMPIEYIYEPWNAPIEVYYLAIPGEARGCSTNTVMSSYSSPVFTAPPSPNCERQRKH